MTRFTVGDKVRTAIAAQGLIVGMVYDVINVIEHHTPFGNVVTYVVNPVDRRHLPIAIGNGHVLLKGA